MRHGVNIWLLGVAWAGCAFGQELPVHELPLIVEEPSGVPRTDWPVTSGVPLPQGLLTDHRATALFNAAGQEIPLQTEILSQWPDGSLRWLLLDFQVNLAGGEKQTLTLRYGANVSRSKVGDPIRVETAADGKVTVNTGAVRLRYDPQFFQPQGTVFKSAGENDSDQEDPITINCGAAGIVLRDDQNRSFRTFRAMTGPAQFTVEQAGPLRSCLRVSGWLGSDEQRSFRYVARIHAYRGQPWIRVFFTFINDRQDALMAKVQKLEMRFYSRRCDYDLSVLNGHANRRGRVLQVDENQYLLKEQMVEGRAAGWAAIGSEAGGMAVGLREFWQNWPTAISCDRIRICLELCPDLPADLYADKPLEEENKLYYAVRDGFHTFKVGVAKTHELAINYFDGKPDAERLTQFFQAFEEPLLAVTPPAHASDSKALGSFPPSAPDRYFGYDPWLDRALQHHLQRRDQIREYGMLNYGDWYGERSVNWGNLEYDLAHGMFVQYLRTGDRRYFARGEQAARHHIDVDVIHATNPFLKNPWGAAPQVGEMWLHCLNHTGGYYEDAPLPVSRTYQMGHSTNFGHVWVGGDFEYYLLTGDRRAREVAIQAADAMVRHCPTAYSDHIRGLGWPIILVLNAYEVTGDPKYLDAATACWQVLKKNIDWQQGWVVQLAKGHCVHPERICFGNVPFMEGLTVSALARYHRVTQDPEVLRAITVGIDQMIRECWVEKDKAFRYTACPLSTPRTYISVCLAAEALAYESTLTGNQEHRRILRDGVREMIRKTGSGDGKSLAQLIHFTPFALDALKDD